MKSLTNRWNAIGAAIGAGMVERWAYFAPRWAIEASATSLDPFRDAAAQFGALRLRERAAQVLPFGRPGHTRRISPTHVPSNRHAA